jgi:hypothetical protein
MQLQKIMYTSILRNLNASENIPILDSIMIICTLKYKYQINRIVVV